MTWLARLTGSLASNTIFEISSFQLFLIKLLFMPVWNLVQRGVKPSGILPKQEKMTPITKSLI